jgi:hypothetical protein
VIAWGGLGHLYSSKMKRLLEGSGNEVERGLLDALRLERPSPELEQRMRDALGLGPVPAPTPAAPVAPAAKALGGWGAIAAGTVAVALLIGGGALVMNQMGEGDAPASPAPAKIVTPSEPAHPAPTPAVAVEPQAPDPQVAEDSNEKPRARSPQSGSRAAQNAQSLREEIQLIDAARLAVKKNESARAVALLDRYARRFPDGAFKAEARVLRTEAQKNRSSAP